MFKIKIDDKFLKTFTKRALELAVKQATNKAIEVASKEAERDLAERYGLRPSPGSRPSYAELSSVKKLTLAELRRGQGARLLGEAKPISLIHMVLGDRQPPPLKGIKRAEREPVRASVRRGTQTVFRRKFIAKPSTRKGGVQVFRRGDYKSRENILIKSALPGVYTAMTREEVTEKMRKLAVKIFNEVLEKRLAK